MIIQPALALLGATLLSFAPAAAQSASPLAARAADALGLIEADIQVLDVPAIPGAPFQVTLDLDGGAHAVLLQSNSVRSDNFEVREQRADGSWVSVDVGPVRTVRGTLPSIPGSVAAGSLEADGLYLRVLLPDGSDRWVQPLLGRLPGATRSMHVSYVSADVIDGGETCGTDHLPNKRPVPFSGTSGGAQYGTGFATAEIGVDADFEYYQDYGSNTASVASRVESVFNTMNVQYERDVAITHTISAMRVRTSSNQPYTQTDAGNLLNQFVNEWRANEVGTPRDIAHLFTGKNINQGTIGIAYLGVFCNADFGYGLVQSDFNGTFSCATDLSAHELGHNWDADHCNCTSNTMNPFITCANVFHPSLTIPAILAHRDSRNCLDGGGPGGDPTELVVASINSGTQNEGQGNKRPVATVVIEDDLGSPVAGVSVTVTFTGDAAGVATGTTGSNGSVFLQSPNRKKGRVRFEACVTAVSGSLPYNGGQVCD